MTTEEGPARLQESAVMTGEVRREMVTASVSNRGQAA